MLAGTVALATEAILIMEKGLGDVMQWDPKITVFALVATTTCRTKRELLVPIWCVHNVKNLWCEKI